MSRKIKGIFLLFLIGGIQQLAAMNIYPDKQEQNIFSPYATVEEFNTFLLTKDRDCYEHYSEALNYVREGRKEKARPIFTDLSRRDQGPHSLSQLVLGNLAYQEKKYEDAKMWWGMCQHPGAKTNLARLYLACNDEGNANQALQEAMAPYQVSINLFDELGRWALHADKTYFHQPAFYLHNYLKQRQQEYEQGMVSKSSLHFEEAFSCFSSASKKGHEGATLELWKMGYMGLACVKDIEKARRHIENIIDSTHSDAIKEDGLQFLASRKKNPDALMFVLKITKNNGSENYTIYNKALYNLLEDVLRHSEKSILTLCALACDDFSIFNKARPLLVQLLKSSSFYMNGEGVGDGLLRLVNQYDDAELQLLLGEKFYWSLGENNSALAQQCFETAKQKNPEAAWCLAHMYSVKKDFDRAMQEMEYAFQYSNAVKKVPSFVIEQITEKFTQADSLIIEKLLREIPQDFFAETPYIIEPLKNVLEKRHLKDIKHEKQIDLKNDLESYRLRIRNEINFLINKGTGCFKEIALLLNEFEKVTKSRDMDALNIVLQEFALTNQSVVCCVVEGIKCFGIASGDYPTNDNNVDKLKYFKQAQQNMEDGLYELRKNSCEQEILDRTNSLWERIALAKIDCMKKNNYLPREIIKVMEKDLEQNSFSICLLLDYSYLALLQNAEKKREVVDRLKKALDHHANNDTNVEKLWLRLGDLHRDESAPKVYLSNNNNRKNKPASKSKREKNESALYYYNQAKNCGSIEAIEKLLLIYFANEEDDKAFIEFSDLSKYHKVSPISLMYEAVMHFKEADGHRQRGNLTEANDYYQKGFRLMDDAFAKGVPFDENIGGILARSNFVIGLQFLHRELASQKLWILARYYCLCVQYENEIPFGVRSQDFKEAQKLGSEYLVAVQEILHFDDPGKKENKISDHLVWLKILHEMNCKDDKDVATRNALRDMINNIKKLNNDGTTWDPFVKICIKKIYENIERYRNGGNNNDTKSYDILLNLLNVALKNKNFILQHYEL